VTQGRTDDRSQTFFNIHPPRLKIVALTTLQHRICRDGHWAAPKGVE
jgi:hypothetical protein